MAAQSWEQYLEYGRQLDAEHRAQRSFGRRHFRYFEPDPRRALYGSTVSSIVFSPSASAFKITCTPESPLTIAGAGVVNNSGFMQKLSSDQEDNTSAAGGFIFTNSATSESNTAYTLAGATDHIFGDGGDITFHDTSSADHATFDVFGSAGDAYPVNLNFYD